MVICTAAQRKSSAAGCEYGVVKRYGEKHTLIFKNAPVQTVGIWRRAGHVLTIQPWQRLSQAQRHAVEAEAGSLPLPGIARPLDVRWDDG